MRSGKWIIAPALLAFAITASAATKTVTLFDKTSLNGSALAAGEYKVRYDEAGSVTFLKGKEVVAKAQGKVVPAKKAIGNTITMRTGGNGSKIVSIQFENSTSEIVIED
jgi:uncharacterized cupin superfamily protein